MLPLAFAIIALVFLIANCDWMDYITEGYPKKDKEHTWPL